MTYCVGMWLDDGLVFMSDTRTNAGVDNIATARKLFTFENTGERFITILTAGNLATTQTVISMLEERTKAPAERSPSIMEAPSMFQVARIIGQTLREVIADTPDTGQRGESPFDATLIVGGQIAGDPQRLLLIYPEGNFIEAGKGTPYFQIGETKYGRPILVRAYEPEMSFEAAVKLLLVSFDSTIKANLSVGPPLDMQLYETDSCTQGLSQRIDADNEYLQTISKGWGSALKKAFESLPDVTLDEKVTNHVT